jgi:hypothetical protein
MTKDKKKNAKTTKGDSVELTPTANSLASDTSSRQELIEIAKELKIKNYSRLSKPELIKEINLGNSEVKDSIKNQETEATKINEKKPVLEPLKDKIKPEIKVEIVEEDKYETLSRQELVEIAKDLKIKNYSRFSKLELINAINKSKVSKNTGTQKIPVLDLSNEAKLPEKKNMDEEPLIIDLEAGKTPKDLEVLSRQELVDMAQELKIKNYSRLSKARLIKLISETISIKNKEISGKIKSTSTKEIKKEKLNTEKVEELEDQAEQIEKIGKHTESPYVDKKEAKSIEDEIKSKILLRPSKFPFGKTNKEYLLEEEETQKLPEFYDEDKIVLLPVDPYKIFTYWNLKHKSLKLIEELELQHLVIKVNDVTSIIYNGSNANHFWFETCLPFSRNWYLNMSEGNKNICVELGYILQGRFYKIATSNTIYVPPKTPSHIVEDRFVIVNLPEIKTKTQNLQKKGMSSVYVSRKPSPYFRLDNYNPRFHEKPTQKMPVFSLAQEIPEHFIQEYNVTGPSTTFTEEYENISPPEKLQISKPEIKAEPIFEAEKPQETNPIDPFSQITTEKIPETIINEFEYFPDFGDGSIINKFYYEIPGSDKKMIKVFYEWEENNVPFRKEIYWVSDVIPDIHQNIYKVSWGPVWVKEFIGGSEYIRYLGASERFLGGSEMFMGGSEMFLGASGKFLGASEYYLGGSDRFMGGSETFYPGGSERFAGGSEMFSGSSNHYFARNFRE